MAEKQNRIWRRARTVFRSFRQIVLFIVLAVVVTGIYLNVVGLPDFAKRPILARLRAQGWDVSFRNIRWNLYRGVIIDQPSFRQTNETSFQFSATRTDFDINWLALKDSTIEIHGIDLLGGDFVLPQLNRAPLHVRDLKAKLRFRPGDEVEVVGLDANVQGANVSVHGTLAHASALFREKQAPAHIGKTLDLQDVWDVIDQLQLTGPAISLEFRGDARNLEKLKSELLVSADSANSPWGKVAGFKLSARFNSAEQPVSVRVTATEVNSEHCALKALSCKIIAEPLETLSNIWKSQIDLTANQVKAQDASNSVRAVTVQFTGNATNSLQSLEPLGAAGRLRLMGGSLHLQELFADATFDESDVWVHYAPVADAQRGDSNSWSALRPFTATWKAALRDVHTAQLSVQNVNATADWEWPKLSTHLSAELGGKQLTTDGHVDASTKHIDLRFSSDIDPKQLASIVPAGLQKYLSDCSWEVPPHFEGDIHYSVPQTGVVDSLDALSDLTLHGRLTLNGGSFRTVTINSLETDVQLSNSVWRLPNLRIVRPEGEFKADLVSDTRTGTFRCALTSGLDPKLIAGELPELAKTILVNDLQFTRPPLVQVEASGNWNEITNTTVTGHVTATNFVYQKLPISFADTDLQFTNNVLVVSNGHVDQGAGHGEVPEIRVDLNQNRIFFKDVRGNIDPWLLTGVITQEAYDAIDPYRYATPPMVSVNGSIGFFQIEDADMHFSVSGQNFRWEWFRAEEASADVHWTGRDLIVTNGVAKAYGNGRVQGWTVFDFRPRGRANYRFDVSVTNVDALTFAKSIGETNGLEGTLSGNLKINSADTTALETWQGYGRLELRDGLIWDVPVVGVLSPVLDAMIPGFGRSRAREAQGDFIITNGVAVSDNFEIHASTFRMQYRGSVDLHRRISARVMAEVLRDAPGVGRVVSFAFMPLSKLFEYRLSGDLKDPKAEPVFVPKFVMMTLRPFHTVKKLLREAEESSAQPVGRQNQ